jgi:hypothetical protein
MGRETYAGFAQAWPSSKEMGAETVNSLPKVHRVDHADRPDLPVLSGKATPDQLIYRDQEQTKFRLTDTDVHSSGVVILTYAPVD